jgi:RNA-directed DNA polymerase
MTRFVAGLTTTNLISLERLITPHRLTEAAHAVARRGGRAGPDGVRLEVFMARLESNVAELYGELCVGSYRPRASLRLSLPAGEGKLRRIGVPCVRDRVVGRALARGLEQCLGARLNSAACAYREGLGALHAVRRTLLETATQPTASSARWLIRGDIADFFDSVPHHKMLGSLEPYLDSAVLELIKRILEGPVREGNLSYIPRQGLPQGSSLSPWLSNFYLIPFDQAVSLPATCLIRYCDDFVLFGPGSRWAGAFLERCEKQLGDLNLRLNPHKTRLASAESGFEFLGFAFSGDTVRVSPARLEAFRSHMLALTRSSLEYPEAHHPLERKETVQEANALIRGWRAYYHLGGCAKDFAELDAWLAEVWPTSLGRLERLSPQHTVIRQAPSLGESGGVRRKSAGRGGKSKPLSRPKPVATHQIGASQIVTHPKAQPPTPPTLQSILERLKRLLAGRL